MIASGGPIPGGGAVAEVVVGRCLGCNGRAQALAGEGAPEDAGAGAAGAAEVFMLLSVVLLVN